LVAPIYTYENILENAGILMEDESKQKKSDIPVQESSAASKDLHKMTLEELQKLLTDVLEQEDYIRAIEIRDEINKRK
jgi:protein-arginine kinase activator protein McsA